MLAAKGGGGELISKPVSLGNRKKSSRRPSCGAVSLRLHDGIRVRAARGLRGRRARYWKTNFGNWVKFSPPLPKCVASGATQCATGVVAQFGRDRGAASFVLPSAGGKGIDGDSSSSVMERCSPVFGASVGTVASGYGVGSGIWAGVQAVARVLRGATAGVAQPVQAGQDFGASGAAQAPVGQSLAVQGDVGSSAPGETAAWAEEKSQLLLRIEELKCKVAGLSLELKSKRARTRRDNAKMQDALRKEHEAQVAELRSQAKAAWDAGAAQAAELATEQRVTSELSHQVDLAEKQINILKALLRSAVERA